MFITNSSYNSSLANKVFTPGKTAEPSVFQATDPTDLVEIGKSVDSQDRFLNFDGLITVFGAGAGTIGGGVVGTAAYAFGAPGWAIPLAAVGGGVIGGVLGHISEKR